MPKINELTNRPGGLQPTDEIWVADGATADFKINGNNLLNFIAANLSTIALPIESYTPTVLGASGNPSVTYHTQFGRYVRLGPLMFLEVKIGWSALSGGSGQLRISLPPGVSGLADQSSNLPITLLRNATLPASTFAVSLGGYNLGLLASRAGIGEANVNVNDIGSNATIWASGWVRVS